MNEFINSIRVGKNQEFRDKYRTIDLLLVDDIQFLADKEGTQDEFFHTFNALYNANKQIVISSDRPPSELVKFHERLLSRFDNGTMVDVSQPDFETRMAILQKKLEYRDLNLAPEVIRFIAKNISSNIRALEGALNTVASFAKLTDATITTELCERALRGKVTESEKREITVDLIQDVVGRHFSVTKDEIRSKKRTQNITYARHVSMYLCRMCMDLTHFQIGQAFGKRDHTSVIYACNKISEDVENQPELRQTLYTLEKEIKGE
jgi:chromosomal replication initiator protein